MQWKMALTSGMFYSLTQRIHGGACASEFEINVEKQSSELSDS